MRASRSATIASIMDPQPLALLVLLALLVAAGVINFRALLALDPESRQKLAESVSGFRVMRFVALLAALLVLRIRVTFLVVVLAIIAISYVYQLVRLRKLALPERYVRHYRLSAALALIGMVAFTVLILVG